jgi:ATPase subunit of ABC transporter with duplicated ATPase domains
VVSVTHDRYFLDNVAQWILELDRGQGIPWKGNYSSWLEQKEARLAREEKQETARKKALARELEWARMAPKARIAKNKARLNAYEKLASQEYEEREDELVMQIPPGPHLGDLVVRAEGVRKGYGDNILVEDLNFNLPKGGIVGIIGPNGAGKTTLFRMIVGEEKPDSGTLRVGETVVPAYVQQGRDTKKLLVAQIISCLVKPRLLPVAMFRASILKDRINKGELENYQAGSATGFTLQSFYAVVEISCCLMNLPMTWMLILCERLKRPF